MNNSELRIGLIGSQSMHAWTFAQACNEPLQNGNYRFPNVRVTAVYGVDDTSEHLLTTMEKGSIPRAVSSLEELIENCNAFMILQRRGEEHMAFAEKLIEKGYPVFIDKPVCCSQADIQKLAQLAKRHDAVICGGSGFKYNKQILALKEKIASDALGHITDACITYSADTESPFGGIFFYLPHAVEVMLELFGYDWQKLRVDVETHDHFRVHVTYPNREICLNLNNSKICRVEISAEKAISEEIDAGDIFIENMRHFVTAAQNQQITKDTALLTEHVRLILAVNEAIESKTEIYRAQV